MSVYKEGQGNLTRFGAVLLATIIAAYAAFSWYLWWISSRTNLTLRDDSAFFSTGALIGATILLVGIVSIGIWLSFYKSVTSEFLIDVDTELKKVVWPEVLPLFDPKTSAWGSTYVVIVTTVILTVYIGLIDVVLSWTLTANLLKWLLVS